MLMPGGMGGTWRSGDFVFKPASYGAGWYEWEALVLAAVRTDQVRVQRVRRARDGRVVVNGWVARDFVSGTHEPRRWPEIIEAGDAFHAALAEMPDRLARPPAVSAKTPGGSRSDRLGRARRPRQPASPMKRPSCSAPAGVAAGRPDRQCPVLQRHAPWAHRLLSIRAPSRLRRRRGHQRRDHLGGRRSRPHGGRVRPPGDGSMPGAGTDLPARHSPLLPGTLPSRRSRPAVCDAATCARSRSQKPPEEHPGAEWIRGWAAQPVPPACRAGRAEPPPHSPTPLRPAPPAADRRRRR